jgi:multidrug transporter EmrE-like cation transporter
MTYLLVLLGMVLNVAAQVALKFASAPVAGAAPSNPLADPWRLATNPYFLFRLVLYAVSVINWVVVLARMDLSVAYPLMSVGYILTLFAGVWLFHEPINSTRIIGVVTIMIGVVLITRPVVAHG